LTECYRTAMPFMTIVDTDRLAPHLSDGDWAVIDCQFRLEDPQWGEAEYLARHIPGAVHASLDRHLSGAATGTNGRHPLPDPTLLAKTLGQFGIEAGVQVVAYDQDSGVYASRLWWLLRWLGHQDVAVLDGGLAKWIAEGRPAASGHQSRAYRTFTGTPRPDLTVNADQVAEIVSRHEAGLVDARAPERYRGEIEPIDRVAGHIPGAICHFHKLNMREDGRFRSAADLRALWGETLGVSPANRVVCYCGSGVTACHNLLALEQAGLTGARLYPGSWSEWSSDPARPVERG